MPMKWELNSTLETPSNQMSIGDVIDILLSRRFFSTPQQIQQFFHPVDPFQLSAEDVGIDTQSLADALSRIQIALKNKEMIVVYADYDADGITAGTIMWETLHEAGARVMPYIPHRVEEGYGLSIKGIDTIVSLYNPLLIITVDHGITGSEKVEYAKSRGIS